MGTSPYTVDSALMLAAEVQWPDRKRPLVYGEVHDLLPHEWKLKLDSTLHILARFPIAVNLV
jgi:hypothetical protein